MKFIKKFDKVNEDLVVVPALALLSGAVAFAAAYLKDKRAALNAFYEEVAEKEGKTVEEIKAELKNNPAKKAELKKVISQLNQDSSNALGRILGV